ncbi:MAG: hypothetical protein JSS61_04905 [Verrucomicrobia bacterium]|nr:hypothetical protein [Verrucomicrobiota bacterium]
MRILSGALILFAAGCEKPTDWESSQITSHAKEHCSSRLYYCSQDPVGGIDVEVIETAEHLRAYLIIHSSPIPSERAIAHFDFGDKTLDSPLHPLQGGQRFLIPDAVQEILLASLRAGKSVQIKLAGYEALIPSSNKI